MKPIYKVLLSVCLSGVLGLAGLNLVRADIKAGPVFFSEIAWMGTQENSADEWIELYNASPEDVDITGWGIYEQGGEILIEPLEGVIKAKSFYLIERTDEQTLPNISASQEPTSWGGYGLKNTGEHLVLKNDKGQVIDSVDCQARWFAGNRKTKQTMERKNFSQQGSDPNTWQTSADAGGTPKQQNSLVPSHSTTATVQQEKEAAKKNKGKAGLAIKNEAGPKPEPQSAPAPQDKAPSQALSEQTAKTSSLNAEHLRANIAPSNKSQANQKLNQTLTILVATALAVASAAGVLWLKNRTDLGRRP